jgi:hypothetical protein
LIVPGYCPAALPVDAAAIRALSVVRYGPADRGWGVAEYRVFVLGKAGQILGRHDFEAADDASALDHARKYVTRSHVEVWQENRLVGALDPPKGAA